MNHHPGLIGSCLAVAALSLLVACAGELIAPDFDVELFDGSGFQLSDRNGENVVVINFWYPSCAPCREEMPEFQKASEKLEGEGIQFIGLFVPLGFDTEHAAREFVDELGLTFNFATDHQKTIATAYGIEFFPTTWFIDRGGRVATTHSGALDAERIITKVRELTDG